MRPLADGGQACGCGPVDHDEAGPRSVATRWDTLTNASYTHRCKTTIILFS